MLAWQRRLRRTFYDLRLEGEGLTREAAALGMGLFIGCIPVYGFHLLTCWIVGRVLRLNRLKMLLASNISNPFFSPVLLFTELQTGAWAQRHAFHDITLDALRSSSPWTFGADLLLGGVIVGAVVGVSVAAITLATGRLRAEDRVLTLLWRRSSDPYLTAGVAAWEFARIKLRGDPVYRALLQPGVLSPGTTLVHLGCGKGLTLSMLREASRMHEDGEAIPPLPDFARMVGVELRARAARMARQVVGDAVTIVEGDVRAFELPSCGNVLLLDVLHLISPEDQDHLLRRVVAALEQGGAVILREPDAAGGVGFLFVQAGKRLNAIVTGNWRQRFAFRTHEEWTDLLQRLGLRVEVRRASRGRPVANVLIVGRRHSVYDVSLETC